MTDGEIVFITVKGGTPLLIVSHSASTIVPPFFLFPARFFHPHHTLNRETLSRVVNRVHVLLERISPKIRISYQTTSIGKEIPDALVVMIC